MPAWAARAIAVVLRKVARRMVVGFVAGSGGGERERGCVQS